MTDAKVRENRLRRMAERQGYQLMKSRRRDPRAADFGRFYILDPTTNGLVIGGQFGAHIDDVDAFLNGATATETGIA